MSTADTVCENRKEKIISFLQALQKEIIGVFSSFENSCSFQKTPWTHTSGGGGGVTAVLRGEVFEKAAVNWSAVSGDQFPGDDSSGPFFATGVSLITHMHNPYAPTAHMNVRYIETEKEFWFGGGYDLTPMGFAFEEDNKTFHGAAKKALDPFGEGFYPTFSEQAKNYFYIPHRKKERGVGGIFFDHYNSENFECDFSLLKAVGKSFLNAYVPILERRIHTPYSEREKCVQKKIRGHYVEFNLLYDRGTRFGFQSGGNPEAILCSLPPEASW